jgi:hypothetical protein
MARLRLQIGFGGFRRRVVLNGFGSDRGEAEIARDAWLKAARAAGKPVPRPRYRPAMLSGGDLRGLDNSSLGAPFVVPPLEIGACAGWPCISRSYQTSPVGSPSVPVRFLHTRPFPLEVASLAPVSSPTRLFGRLECDVSATNIWGERAYFFNSHRDGGDYAWHKDNLTSAPYAPTCEQIMARWTFAGAWDPERTDGPRLVGGSGTSILEFSTAKAAANAAKPKLDFNGGTIIACEAGAVLRIADTNVP